MQAAAEAILKRYAVTGLVTVTLRRDTERRTIRAYRGAPARVEAQHRYLVTVKENRAQRRVLEPRLGWRVYVTNAPARQLPLGPAVLAYREQWLAERNCARLKGRPLSVAPVVEPPRRPCPRLDPLAHLGRARAGLAEYQVRRTLAQDERELVGLYPASQRAAPPNPLWNGCCRPSKR